MKRNHLLIIFSMCVLIGKAQPYEDKLLIMGSPQHLIIGGLSLDFDVKIKPNSWLVFSPQYYIDVNNTGGGIFLSGYNSMSGGGLGIANKLFLSKYPFYFSYGAAYHYFDISRDLSNPYNYTFNQQENIAINRITGKCIIGFQKALFEHLYLDLFLGFGVRYSMYDKNSSISVSNTFLDLGYSGVMPFGGFRFGVGF